LSLLRAPSNINPAMRLFREARDDNSKSRITPRRQEILSKMKGSHLSEATLAELIASEFEELSR
jgi:hypothetical protein